MKAFRVVLATLISPLMAIVVALVFGYYDQIQYLFSSRFEAEIVLDRIAESLAANSVLIAGWSYAMTLLLGLPAYGILYAWRRATTCWCGAVGTAIGSIFGVMVGMFSVQWAMATVICGLAVAVVFCLIAGVRDRRSQ